MDVRELRLGNYIYDDFNEVHIVEHIESQKYNDWNGSDPALVVFSKINDEYNHMYSCDKVSPIPLTEEWALKFGFACENTVGGFVSWKKGNFKLLDRKLPSPRVMKPIVCVHQLQNLYYALTGQELEVK